MAVTDFYGLGRYLPPPVRNHWQDFIDAIDAGGGGGVEDFTDLGDVPSSYSGQGGKFLAVTVGEDGIEFVVGGGGGGDYNIDGGRADSIYTPEQSIDGGGA